MYELLKRMEKDGYVARQRTSSDRRLITFHLTDRAKLIAPTLYNWIEANNDAAMAGIDLKRVVLFKETLKQMIANLSNETL